ncbi:DJ-1/PfpI family protein [Patescibacteria group bacterium]
MKKVIMIIAPENFRDEEYFQTRESLEKKGVEVTVASTQTEAVSGIDKTTVHIDVLVADATTDYDGIVFVGGSGAKVYFNNEKALNLAQAFYEEGKIVAAICIAPLILGHAGILQDKKVTSWEGAREELLGLGADYTGKDVCIDGKVITASGPRASYKFGKKIAKAL